MSAYATVLTGSSKIKFLDFAKKIILQSSTKNLLEE